MDNRQYLKVAVEAAKKSGPIFKQYFGKPKDVQMKNGNPRDLVTEIDTRIESQIRKTLQQHFPKHKIIGEEFGRHNLEKNDLIWIIDPIDGTKNFIQGLPMCCISIALWDKDGPLVAVVYNPVLNYLFTAIRGGGAFLNGKKIQVSNKKQVKDGFGGYGWGRNTEQASKHFPKLVKILGKVRTLGSATHELSFVALGVYDFQVHAEINIWDFAAAVLLIMEAGGKVTDWSGKKISIETKNMAAGNKSLHAELIRILKNV